MKVLKRLKVFSFARLQSLLMGFIGLILGVLYSFGGLIIDSLVSLGWLVSKETPGLSFGTVLAFGALIGMPLILATAGFFTGIIEALLYNAYAKRFGGLKIDFELED